MLEFIGSTAAELYEEGLHKFRICGRKEPSRNGPVLALPDVATFTLTNPMARILSDPTRNANPFFHMMEFVWMMAGRNDAKWLMQFNQQMGEYADNGILWAAYGNRWRFNWGKDQIWETIKLLQKDKNTRQAVIAMWDPFNDMGTDHKDKACNTHIMFRYNAGALDMLVCNRSNDFIWGAMGANIVHMTMLHELIAHFAEIPLGKYTVVSNNLHIYTDRPDYERNIQLLVVEDIYSKVVSYPYLDKLDDYGSFVYDCENFCVDDLDSKYTSTFMMGTVVPAFKAWRARKDFYMARAISEGINLPDWRTACQNWLKLRHATSSSATSTEPSP